MKFIKVEIENFGTIAEATVTLDDRGLVLLQGDNRDDPSADSNGAGKSTVVEAISWALYGKTAKGVTGDSVINRLAGKGCRVRVQLEDGDEIYRIARHRKHKTGKNSLTVEVASADGAHDGDLTKGTDKLTQELVDQVMGCPYDVFVAAVYSGQEAMADLPSMTDKNLKMLIEEASGITTLERAYVEARARALKASGALDKVNLRVSEAKRQVERHKERLEDTLSSVKRWEAEVEARVIDLGVEARREIADAKSYEVQLSKLERRSDLERERGKLQVNLDNMQRDTDRLEALNRTRIDRERTADRQRDAAEREVAQVKALRAKMETVEAQRGAPCSTCKRPHDDSSLAATLATIAQKIEDGRAAAKEAVAQLKTASQSATEAATEAEAFKAGMTDVSRVVALSDAISQKLAEIDRVEGKVAAAREQARRAVEKVKREKAQTNPFRAQVAERRDHLKEARAAAERAEAKVDPANKALEVADSVVDVFSPKGVRAHILDTVTPYLNARTAHYLGTLADGRIEAIWQTITLTARGEPRENFSIQVTHSDGGSSFAECSGGEKRKVRLACGLALQDLVATRATKQIDLWIGDEIDTALDDAGLERLMQVLEDKARERGTVLVVSHSDLKAWFRNSLTVIKQGGVSTVEEDA